MDGRQRLVVPAVDQARPRLGRRRVRVGADADVTIFDPATVIDRATYAEPLLPSAGIAHVLVAGVPVVRDGRFAAVDMERSGVTIETTGKIETPSAVVRMSRLPGKFRRAIAYAHSVASTTEGSAVESPALSATSCAARASPTSAGRSPTARC